MKNHLITIGALLLTLGVSGLAAQESWKPAKNRLWTTWGESVTPDNLFPEYPRPQMVRKNWANLNGLWNFTVTDKDASRPAQFPRADASKF
jgi:hypothetical protein